MSAMEASDRPRDGMLDEVDLTPVRDMDGHSDSPSLDRNARIRAEMISEMIRQSGHLRTSPFILIAVLAMVYMDRAPIWPTALLGIGMIVFVFLGIRLRRAFDEAAPAASVIEAWGLRYTVLSGFVGLVWGPALAGYFDPASYPHQAFLALLAVGSLFAAIMHRALYPPAFVAMAVPAALPLITMFALTGTQLGLVTAGLGVFGLIGLLASLRVLHRRFRESFSLRFENTDLIERLETAHRSAEKARQAAEAGDRTKSEFLATISHELRTPMNGIIGMTGLMLGTRLSAQQRSYADIVKESADALLNLINDILDLTKLESGRVDLDESPFEVSQTIEGAVALMAERAQAKGLILASHIGPSVPDIMTADAGRLRQVLLNLLANAIKFTESGTVSLDAGLAPHSRSVLRIRVVDTGIGIDAETLPRLFRPFSQAGGVSRRYGGTGLGLAISRRLIDAMGGEIHVDSQPGEGTTFTVDLPVRSGKTIRRTDLLESTPVLLAGPDDSIRAAAARYAGDWKARVACVDSPADALKRMREGGGPWVVVIDWRLRGGAGALAQQIRGDARLARSRLILTVPVGVIDSVAEDESGLFDVRLLQPVRRVAFNRALSGKQASEDAVVPARRPGKTDGPSLRVLVVDDVAVNQKLAMSIVEIAGHEAVAAGSGREALQALRSLPYDLVLMDVEMPEMDGLEATRAIRQLPGATSRTPIVAITAHPGDAFVQRCMDAGMDGYLSKPLNADHLGDILAEHAGRSDRASAGTAPDAILARLAETVGAETAREMGESFVAELESWIPALESALADNDREALRQNAHSLKGAALNMGCRGLADAAAALSATPDAAPEILRGHLTETKRQAKAASRALNRELKDRKG